MDLQKPKRQIMGLHPALFTGVVMLTVVAILAIVLVFTGDIAEQGARVFWTVLAFAVFTGLLALDLSLSRTSSKALIIGIIAGSYMIIVLMLTIWMEDRRNEDFGVSLATFELIYMVPVIVVITRAAWALAWAVMAMGEKIRTSVGPVFGVVTASLVGLAGVLLTLHFPLGRLSVTLSDWYWRSLVAVTILAALASCVLMLLYWNQRSTDAKSQPQPAVQNPQVPPMQQYPNPQHPQQQYPKQVPNPQMQQHPPQMPPQQQYPPQQYPPQQFPPQQ